MPFIMKLALALGKSLGELGEMSSDELNMWLAFNRTNPIPDPWLQTGVTASTIANSQSTKKRYKPTTFMPIQKRIIRRQSAQQQYKHLALILNLPN